MSAQLVKKFKRADPSRAELTSPPSAKRGVASTPHGVDARLAPSCGHHVMLFFVITKNSISHR
jgi:hypothetical protein